MSDEESQRSARDYALAALARREHSRHELALKLESRGFEALAITTVLEALAAAGLQNDERFAEAYVRYRGARGYGPRRIAQELRQRGIRDELLHDALNKTEHDWFESARDVRAKKYRHAPGSFTERARQTRFMEYRGFDSEQIRYAFGNSTDDENI